MPAATMRTSVTRGVPSRKALTPAATAPAVKATSRISSKSPEAWIMRRTTGHSRGPNGWGPTSASMMRKLSARMSSGRVIARLLHRVTARRHHDRTEAASLRIADVHCREHINTGSRHLPHGRNFDRLLGPEGVAHHADRGFGRAVGGHDLGRPAVLPVAPLTLGI